MSLHHLVSVIIPVYNAEKYIVKCMHSLMAQTYTNFEVLLVDDGSQDASRTIMQNTIKGDERFKIICQDNVGSGRARNAGIQQASGEYLCFVDADDYVNNNYLYLLYYAIIKDDADIAVCCVQIIDGDAYTTMPLASTKNHDWSEALKNLLIVSDGGCPCDKMYKRSIFDLIEFPGGHYEDIEMLVSLFAICRPKKISCVDKALYIYVQRQDSKTHSVNIKNIQDAIAGLKNIRSILKDYDLWNEYGRMYVVLYIRRVNYVAGIIALYSADYYRDMNCLFDRVDRQHFNLLRINSTLLIHIRSTSFRRLVVINLLCFGVAGQFMHRCLFRLRDAIKHSHMK